MARKPDTPCSSCGKLLYRGSTSLERPICRDCRRKRRLANCPRCGKEFDAKSAAYCSRHCSDRAGRRQIVRR
jgi:endogenous inhibitor of DNA gyrase (YacG/DUF329 family)